MSPKTQRWDWAVSLELTQISDDHIQQAYKLNWDNLCKPDSCRKNCKKILCIACFDKSWIDNDHLSNSSPDNYNSANCEQKRADLKSFVGLKNLGATCYVNCLLQLWYHNPALRKAIYQWDKDGILDPHIGTSHTNNNNKLAIDDRTSRTESTSSKNANATAITNASHQQSPSSKRAREPDSITGSDRDSPAKKNLRLEESSTKQSQKDSQQQLAKLSSPAKSNPSNHNNQQNNNFLQSYPIEQLQLIFARLQFTNKKSIDPFCFIDSLALNAAEQQDAQEFKNLFMDFLEKSFANQKNPFVSKVIQNQFCGTYSYVTICDHCNHKSVSDSKFYELDLSIQNLETLYDCLNEYFKPKALDGKYNCSNCQKAQSAHRKIVLDSLPPTLNLQLLRFVYDVQRSVRQKLNSHIIFPEILDMARYLESDSTSNPKPLFSHDNAGHCLLNGRISSTAKSDTYMLTAVLIHRGSSPHSGHYIAHIKDRATKDWYKFNDDSVERIGPQLQVSTDGENITIVEDRTETVKVVDEETGKVTRMESKSLKSKTAYMLVYQAIDNETLYYPSDHSEDWHLPFHLQTAVLEENSQSDQIFESLKVAREVDEQIINARKAHVRSIYDKLVCRSPQEKFEFIDKFWLQRWLTDSSSSAKFPPIDNSHLLCIHQKLDFRKIDQAKCVRSEGAELLYKEFGVSGPRLKDALCRDCVELEIKLIQLKERMKEDQKFITSQAKFKIGPDYDFEDAFIVGKNSYRDWQSLVMVQFKKSNPEYAQRESFSKSQTQQGSDDDDLKSTNKHNGHNNTNGNDNESDSDSDEEAMEKFVFNSDILCEHDQLINDHTAWRIVPKEVWAIFKHYFGNDSTRPLIERNANTIMCFDCKRQEEEQQEIGDLQKQKASEQKSKLSDLFHGRKRASWFSMLPGDVYYALDRQFLTRWQKFIRNPCNQEQPTEIRNRDNIVCEHGRPLYDASNCNPVLPECPLVLITREELENLKMHYTVDHEIKFSIHPTRSEEKLRQHLLKKKATQTKKTPNPSPDLMRIGPIPAKQKLDGSGDPVTIMNPVDGEVSDHLTNVFIVAKDKTTPEPAQTMLTPPPFDEEPDLTEIDWSDCVISEPGFCSDCHKKLEQDELERLLNYDTATIYITRVENCGQHAPNNNHHSTDDVCDTARTHGADNHSGKNPSDFYDSGNEVEVAACPSDDSITGLKRRKKLYAEDEGNDFVPPGASKTASSNSMLRRTTRRNRSREQAYTIKPTQTLLQLKKEIFQRFQVLPCEQRLFLNDMLLSDNSKTMYDLRMVPNSSLKLEVDKPIADTIDLIEDEPSSRKSYDRLCEVKVCEIYAGAHEMHLSGKRLPHRFGKGLRPTRLAKCVVHPKSNDT